MNRSVAVRAEKLLATAAGQSGATYTLTGVSANSTNGGTVTLSDGLVDKHRNVKPMYAMMADYFATIDGPGLTPYRFEPCGSLVTSPASSTLRALDLSAHQASPAQRAAWDDVLTNLPLPEPKVQPELAPEGPTATLDPRVFPIATLSLTVSRPALSVMSPSRVMTSPGFMAAPSWLMDG